MDHFLKGYCKLNTEKLIKKKIYSKFFLYIHIY